jgi:hypothetical protein
MALCVETEVAMCLGGMIEKVASLNEGKFVLGGLGNKTPLMKFRDGDTDITLRECETFLETHLRWHSRNTDRKAKEVKDLKETAKEVCVETAKLKEEVKHLTEQVENCDVQGEPDEGWKEDMAKKWKAEKEKVSGLTEELAKVNKKLEDQEIYGIDPNDDGEPDQSEEIEELRKSIVNGMSLKQAKSILDPAKQKHLDCPKRGDCDTEDTVLGRLWEFIQEDGWKSKYMCM